MAEVEELPTEIVLPTPPKDEDFKEPRLKARQATADDDDDDNDGFVIRCIMRLLPESEAG